jgi:integrase/recombinase XerC
LAKIDYIGHVILQTFIQYLTYEKRFSPHTITAYRSDIEQFQTFLLHAFDETNVLEATPSYVRSWMVHLIQSELEVRSVRRKRSVLNSLFNFAIRQELLTINPMEQVTVPKMKKKLPGYLRDSQLEQLESLLPEMINYAQARDRAIVELLFSTGMRRAELINLSLSDVRLSERTIQVIGKRNKARIIPITHVLLNTLTLYLEFRLRLDTEQHAFFLTDGYKPLYPKFVYNLVKRYLSGVTSVDGRGPHLLRHTFATLMLDQGADINAIKELLGHADLNATQVYTHTSVEKLKASYAKAHPKANAKR